MFTGGVFLFFDDLLGKQSFLAWWPNSLKKCQISQRGFGVYVGGLKLNPARQWHPCMQTQCAVLTQLDITMHNLCFFLKNAQTDTGIISSFPQLPRCDLHGLMAAEWRPACLHTTRCDRIIHTYTHVRFQRCIFRFRQQHVTFWYRFVAVSVKCLLSQALQAQISFQAC